MKTFAALAVVAAVSAFAAPSVAADAVASQVNVQSVRIALTGKSDAQVRTEIRGAAATVCGAASGDCWSTSVSKAYAEFGGVLRARKAAATPVRVAKLEDGRASVATVRVALTGRSSAEIEADIKAAADTVCKATNDTAPDYRDCVVGAVRSAKIQLRQFARTEGSSQVASL